MLGDDRLFVLSNKVAYQVLPDLVDLNISDGRELWRHSFPCEQDPLNYTACRPELWNHQAVGDSALFAAAGKLYGIDTASGNVIWSYGLTVDNWNLLAYVDGVLYALNTPNSISTITNIVAFAVTQTVSEMPTNLAIIFTLTLLSIQVLTKRANSRRLNR